MSWRPALPALLFAILTGCSSQTRTTREPGSDAPADPQTAPSNAAPAETSLAPAQPTSDLKEAFPHIRVDQTAKLIEIDGIVPIDCHDPQTPDVYLEVTVCTRDSKEHESLVMTDAKPSQLHAALLLLGLEPGKPGAVKFDGGTLTRVAPTGAGLTVTIAYRDAQGIEIESPAADWVINSNTKVTFKSTAAGPSWVFAGSRFITHNGKEWYDADGAGTMIGLTTFGGETIAWSDVHSPESELDDPEWIADPAKVPAFGTPVIVRIRPAP